MYCNVYLYYCNSVLARCMDSVDWNGGMEWWTGLDWNGMAGGM